MHSALWLLLGLRLKARLRRLVRGLRSPRGIIFAVIGVIVLLTWLVPSLLIQGQPSDALLARTRRIGPLALLGICLLNVIFSSAEGGITLGPAESNFLFPAPLSRRQLLAYKIVASLGAALLSAIFITIFARRYAVLTLAAFVAVFLIVTFAQLLSFLLSLLANVLGAIAYNRQRRILIGLVVIVAGVAVYQTAGWQQDWEQALDELLNNRIAQIALAPMQWFINALTAERLWPDLLQWGGLAALVNIVLAGVILSLDAHYLEASASASEKHYARLQRLRGGAHAVSVPTGKTRLTMPFLPRLGGVGPLLWRQLTTALRSLKTLILVPLFFAIFSTPLFVSMGSAGEHSMPGLLISVFIGSALILPPLLPFDFRNDIDRMPFLKTLPLPAWRIVLGELLAPVLILAGCQSAVVGVVALLYGLESFFWGVVALLPPVNFLIFAVENFFFLLFPVRHSAAHPGDFQLLGRNIVIWLAKLTTLGIAVLPASVAGLTVYFILGKSEVLGFIAAELVVLLVVILWIRLLVWAFVRFDVARDTPPE